MNHKITIIILAVLLVSALTFLGVNLFRLTQYAAQKKQNFVDSIRVSEGFQSVKIAIAKVEFTPPNGTTGDDKADTLNIQLERGFNKDRLMKSSGNIAHKYYEYFMSNETIPVVLQFKRIDTTILTAAYHVNTKSIDVLYSAPN
jgi:ribosomal protein S8